MASYDSHPILSNIQIHPVFHVQFCLEDHLQRRHLWIELCPPFLRLYVEALSLLVTIFGDRAFKEVIKVKQYHKSRTLIQYD